MILSGTIGYFVISSGQAFWNVVFFRCVIGAVVLGGYAYYAGFIRREYFQRSVLLMIILGGVTLVRKLDISVCLVQLHSLFYRHCGLPYAAVIFSTNRCVNHQREAVWQLIVLARLGVYRTVFNRRTGSERDKRTLLR